MERKYLLQYHGLQISQTTGKELKDVSQLEKDILEITLVSMTYHAWVIVCLSFVKGLIFGQNSMSIQLINEKYFGFKPKNLIY